MARSPTTLLDGVTFTRCRFDDASLEELVTRRCVFERCVLTGVRLGGSRHSGTAFLSCRFDRARLIDVIWDGCKLTGSTFPGAQLRPMTSTESDWSYTSLRGVDLSGLDLSGQRFRDADQHRRAGSLGDPDDHHVGVLRARGGQGQRRQGE